MQKVKIIADASVYATIALGPVLLVQVYRLVPAVLFYSLLAGWLIYLVAGVGVALKRKRFYILTSILAILVLVLSLSQPEHYQFFAQGNLLAGLTFLVGDIIQVFVLAGSLIMLSGRAAANEKENT
ncbi:MAG: hypothetical protein QXX17_07510 [Conexivisphaerales archaeon]